MEIVSVLTAERMKGFATGLVLDWWLFNFPFPPFQFPVYFAISKEAYVQQMEQKVLLEVENLMKDFRDKVLPVVSSLFPRQEYKVPSCVLNYMQENSEMKAVAELLMTLMPDKVEVVPRQVDIITVFETRRQRIHLNKILFLQTGVFPAVH